MLDADLERSCLACAFRPPPLGAVRCYGPYTGELAGLLRLFKYGGRDVLAGPLADLALRETRSRVFLEQVEVFVPVPLHASRRRRRGYDQARLLAEALACRLGVVQCHGLRRSHQTRPQVGLGAAARRRNVQGAFRPARHAKSLRGKVVCLVDDVWTTGATLCEAAQGLRTVGAAHLLGFTLARS